MRTTVNLMDRRAFVLGIGAAGLAACSTPERDLLAAYENVELPLEPGTAPPATDAPTGTSPLQTVPEPGDPAIDPETGLPVAVPRPDLPGLSFVARAIVSTVVVDEVLNSGDSRFTFDNPIASGGQLVFLVEEFNGLDNFRVLLPTRPNGSFGWVDAADVTLDRHNFRVLVELDDFRLTVFDHEETVFETTVGVARANAPTPNGRYYTTELLRPPAPDSVYGAFAYGLSGYSDTFTEFAGGNGQLGIHGTNDPATLGTNVSSGCIRLHNDDITALVEDLKLPTGVPVEVI